MIAAARHPRLLTAADLAALPTSLPSGGVRYELDDGRLVVLPLPTCDHARAQGRICRYLASDGEDRGFGYAYGSVGVVLRHNPDRVVAPDAAFVLAASLPVRLSPEDWLLTAPELVAEARDRYETPADLDRKAREYLDAGVRLVWVIDPDDRTVTAHRPGQPPQVFAEADTLTCPLIPGFAVPVAKLFVGS